MSLDLPIHPLKRNIQPLNLWNPRLPTLISHVHHPGLQELFTSNATIDQYHHIGERRSLVYVGCSPAVDETRYDATREDDDTGREFGETEKGSGGPCGLGGHGDRLDDGEETTGVGAVEGGLDDRRPGSYT